MASTKEFDNELLPECPFYIRDSDRSVVCEGLIEHSVMTMTFKRSARKKAFCEKTCCSMDYGNCPIAKVLFAKYEEEESYGD